jgi:hypothetical protein
MEQRGATGTAYDIGGVTPNDTEPQDTRARGGARFAFCQDVQILAASELLGGALAQR